MKKNLLFLLCGIFSIAFTLFFTACGQTPAHYGTYYSLNKNDYIIIDNKAHLANNGVYDYTASGDEIIIDGILRLKFFNDFKVICSSDYVYVSQNISLKSRDEFFEGTFSVPQEAYLAFYSDGKINFLMMSDPAAAFTGYYTINNGIICVNAKYVLSGNTASKYYYLDNNLNLYSAVWCKDGAITQMDAPNFPDPSAISPETDNPVNPPNQTETEEENNNNSNQNTDTPTIIKEEYELSYHFSSPLNGYLVSGITGKFNNVIIPSTYKSVPVVGIDDMAFYECSGLKSITIPDSVTSIGREAFMGCSSLKSIIIPDSVTIIGSNAFANCRILTSITIPDGVTCIDFSTFNRCSSLKSITIPDSVTIIYDSAFANCISLTSITIPASVTSIWGGVFDNCSSLTSITIPDSVTIIASSTFNGCSSLKTVYIDSSISLNDTLFADSLPNFATDVFVRTDITPTLSVYTIVYEKQNETVMHDGKEYYHYKIKE